MNKVKLFFFTLWLYFIDSVVLSLKNLIKYLLSIKLRPNNRLLSYIGRKYEKTLILWRNTEVKYLMFLIEISPSKNFK